MLSYSSETQIAKTYIRTTLLITGYDTSSCGKKYIHMCDVLQLFHTVKPLIREGNPVSDFISVQTWMLFLICDITRKEKKILYFISALFFHFAVMWGLFFVWAEWMVNENVGCRWTLASAFLAGFGCVWLGRLLSNQRNDVYCTASCECECVCGCMYVWMWWGAGGLIINFKQTKKWNVVALYTQRSLNILRKFKTVIYTIIQDYCQQIP